MSKSRKDYFWNTFGVLAQNAVSPLLLIAITRINGIDASGLFSYAFAVSIVLFAFGLWGGRTYQVSDAKREFDPRSYVTARVLLAVVTVVAALLFSIANGYDAEKSALIIILVVYKGVESIADSIYGILQSNDGLRYAGRSLVYKSFVSLLVFLVIDISTGSILISSVSLVIVNLLIVLFYDIRIARRLGDVRFALGTIRRFVREGYVTLRRTWAIFAVTFLATFSINIPRFFIDRYDSEQIGYFGIIAVPITLIAVFMSFILQPNILSLAKMFNRVQYDRFRGIIRKIMVITLGFGLVVAIATYLIGVPVLNLVFDVDFTQHKPELMVMIFGGIANAVVAVLISVFTIIRKFKALFYTLLITNLALIALCQIFVQRYGIMGGVVLYSLASLVQAAILLTVYHYELRRRR